MGRDPEVFEESNSFFPERFDRSSELYTPASNGFTSIPFGFGTRSCIGEKQKDSPMGRSGPSNAEHPLKI